jgi:hypothetical protein
MEFQVSDKKNERVHPALKHGGYSGMTVLPGEDRDGFDQLHRNLIDEFAPQSSIEEDIVANIAKLVWRKQNLRTYWLAELAKKKAFGDSCQIRFRNRTLDGWIYAVQTKSVPTLKRQRRKLKTNSATRCLFLKSEMPRLIDCTRKSH